MRVERFRPEDVQALKDFAGQEDIVRLVSHEELLLMIGEGSFAYSLYDGDVLVACVGAVRCTDYRAAGWVLLQTGHTKSFIGITRTVKRLLAALPFKRIETYVDPANSKAIRWARLCGLTCERAYCPYYFPDGRGASEWVLYLG
jgi:hypothetical protein